MAEKPRLAAALLAIACVAGIGAFGAARAAAAGFSHAVGSPFPTTGDADALAVGDLNGDARTDAVIANRTAGTVEVMLGSDKGALAPPLPPIVTPISTATAVGTWWRPTTAARASRCCWAMAPAA